MIEKKLPLERLSEEQRAKLLKDIGYTDETLEEDVLRIKLWLKTQPHLPSQVYDEPDEFFRTFLIGCKGRLETAKMKLDRYYTSRTTLGHMLLPMDPLAEEILKMKVTGCGGVLPKPLPNGCRISFGYYNHPDPETYDPVVFAKRCFMFQELWMRSDGEFAGMWLIIDIKGFTLSHMLKVSPTITRDFMGYLESSFPIRLKGIVAVNAGSFFETTFNTCIRPFLSKKTSERIHIFAEDTRLGELFPKEILPKEYGGEEKSKQEIADMWDRIFEREREWFLTHLSGVCDEEKRLHKLDPDQINGTFRKLNID